MRPVFGPSYTYNRWWKYSIYCSLFLMSSFRSFALADNDVQAILTIAGSSSVNSGIFIPYKETIERRLGHELRVLVSSSGRGLLSLKKGEADFAMVSSSLPLLVQTLNQAEATLRASDFRAVAIGGSYIEFIVQSGSPVISLNREQLSKIFSGRVQNWSELGYPGLGEIRVFTEHPSGGMYPVIVEQLLAPENMSARASALQNGPQVAKVVSQLPNAIGFISSATPAHHRFDTVVVAVQDLSIRQEFYIVAKAEQSPDDLDRLASAIRQAGSIEL